MHYCPDCESPCTCDSDSDDPELKEVRIDPATCTCPCLDPALWDGGDLVECRLTLPPKEHEE